MKILVTGGAGFIGSAVVRHIINKTNDAIINVDKLTYAGNLESLNSVCENNRYTFIQADICDAKLITDIFKQHQPDAIMHLAAESHVDRSIDGPSEFIQTNIIGTYTLLEAARQYWNQLPSDKKMLSVSIIFLLMKFSVTWNQPLTYLQKQHRMHQAALTLHQKHQVTILSELGNVLTVYQPLLLIVLIITTISLPRKTHSINDFKCARR